MHIDEFTKRRLHKLRITKGNDTEYNDLVMALYQDELEDEGIDTSTIEVISYDPNIPY